jgi:FHA domain
LKKPVVLRIFKGEQLLGVKQFTEPQIVFGKPGEVQVALESDRVSLIHAAIEERDSGFFICDLGSETGTVKNGETVLDAPLESGDIIQIGEYRVEFYVGVPKPKGAPGTTGVGITPLPPETAATPTAAPAAAAPTPTAPAQATSTQPSATAPAAATATAASSAAAPAQQSVSPQPAAAAKPAQETPKPAQATAPKAEPSRPCGEVKEKPKTESKKPEASAPFEGVKAPRNPEGGKPTRNVGAARPVVPTPPQDPIPSPELTAPAAAGFSMAGPRARPAARKASTVTSKKAKTFAPPSKYKDVRDYVKPSKGTVVEILVAWRERVIATRHFSQNQTVTIGSHPDSDIVLPILSSRLRKIPLVKIEGMAKVLVTPEMTGELIRGQTSSSFVELLRQNKMIKDGAAYAIALEQGEMVRLEMSDQISVIIRYTSDSPKPLVAPILDLTTSEVTGVILAAVLIAILRLYTFLYTPPVPLPAEEAAEPQRVAVIITPPTPPPVAPPQPRVESTPAPTPAPTPPPQIVRATPAPTKQPDPQPKAQASTNLTTKNDPGKSANAAPNRNKGPRSLTSPKQGGSIKTTNSAAAQAQSKIKDVSKTGLFSTFGAGANDRTDTSHSGAGELAGLADAATGKTGMNENRAGNGLGTATKDTGAGGTGKALTGIQGGIGTSGRGSGNSGYGTGGLGNKAGTKITTGGTGESFSGTIDREAIRRVIKANERTIRTCYERQLNRNPDLFGKLILGWDIADGGRVAAVRVVSNDLGNQEVANCILDRLKTWKFPDPPSGQVVEVAYPFFFSN